MATRDGQPLVWGIPAQWWARHREGKARAARVGDQLILTEVEARRVQGWIANKCPDQMQLPFALWTAQAVRELIHKKFGKSLGLSTMQLYLKRWGFPRRNA